MDGKVLFVDDQNDFLELLKIRLKNENYQKFFLSDPNVVCDFVGEKDIDVVVSDMNMPKNGAELFKELREVYPSVVRIALSGSLNTGTLLMAINDGDVYKYIPKPWKIDESGKNIIKSAIEHANYLRHKNSEFVSVEKLKKVFEKIELNCEVVETKEDIIGDYSLNTKYSLKLK